MGPGCALCIIICRVKAKNFSEENRESYAQCKARPYHDSAPESRIRGSSPIFHTAPSRAKAYEVRVTPRYDPFSAPFVKHMAK